MFLHKVIDPVLIPPLLTYNFHLFELWVYNEIETLSHLTMNLSFPLLILWHFSRFGSKAMVSPPPPRLFASQSNGSSKAINHLLLGYHVLIERASRKQGGWTNKQHMCSPTIKSGPFRGQENHPFKICPKENVNIPCQISQRWMK